MNGSSWEQPWRGGILQSKFRRTLLGLVHLVAVSHAGQFVNLAVCSRASFSTVIMAAGMGTA